MTFSPQQNHRTECHKYKTEGLLYIMPEQKKRHFSPHILLLALIIIVQCVFYIFIFTTKKTPITQMNTIPTAFQIVFTVHF